MINSGSDNGRHYPVGQALQLKPNISHLICFNKPYGVLSQFAAEGRWRGLKDFIDIPNVYVAGRLDADSESLLLLISDGKLQARIADPRFKMEKTYWVQVEGVQSACRNRLHCGHVTRPSARGRRNPTSWLELAIREGRNRQVRRMTAAVGPISIDGLARCFSHSLDLQQHPH
ncbi:pseudouridine synthase [compost metagenome]